MRPNLLTLLNARFKTENSISGKKTKPRGIFVRLPQGYRLAVLILPLVDIDRLCDFAYTR
jgi:hypothetical protein